MWQYDIAGAFKRKTPELNRGFSYIDFMLIHPKTLSSHLPATYS